MKIKNKEASLQNKIKKQEVIAEKDALPHVREAIINTNTVVIDLEETTGEVEEDE